MTDASTILTAFNNQFTELLDDISLVFPKDVEIATAKKSFGMIKKANPKMLIKVWQQIIVSKFGDQIDAGDISFFISKDYSNEFQHLEENDSIMKHINRLREPVKNMSSEDQEKTMKYIQNITKLCKIYFTLN